MRVNKRGLGEKTGPILRDSFLAIFFCSAFKKFFLSLFPSISFLSLGIIGEEFENSRVA